MERLTIVLVALALALVGGLALVAFGRRVDPPAPPGGPGGGASA